MSVPVDSQQPSYRSALLAVAAAAATAAAGLAWGGLLLGTSVLLHVAVSLAAAAGSVLGVVWVRSREGQAPESATPARLRQRAAALLARAKWLPRPFGRRVPTREGVEAPAEEPPPAPSPPAPEEPGGGIRLTLGILIPLATVTVLVSGGPSFFEPSLLTVAVGVAACLAAAGLSQIAVRYLAGIDPHDLPESASLARGGRVVMWLFVLAAAAIVTQWSGLSAAPTVLLGLSTVVVALNIAACYAFVTTPVRLVEDANTFDVDFTFTRVLGSRDNIFASVVDTAQAQLGIDLRSTWALEVVRHAIEPLVIGLALAGWLTTSFTIVAVEEQGLVERLGIPLSGAPLEPGLHVHLPWPIDRVFRVPVQRVQALSVGHEGQEEGGPENVLWAVEHAKNEYTLVLGNGRDLITIDAGVQYKITDARAWFYSSQNPADALRAIAYRAVMRNTVNRTLADALSENLVATTGRMRAMVQDDANAMGLGVQVLNFTVGGMHPPVPVAADYQAVVSAELGKVTAVVNAQATRNRTVPYAESDVLVGDNTARAEGAQMLAQAAGDAWAFRALEAQYRTSPAEYQFRQRLEAFERALKFRRFTILDTRIQRDRGELWITP